MVRVNYRSREELVAAVKKAVARKKEWEETARKNYVNDCERVGMPVVL